MRERIRQAWRALRGQPPDRAQVIAWAHRLGMHRGYVELDCEHCFASSLRRYSTICDMMLSRIGKADAIADFHDYLGRVIEPGNIMVFHEHPAYLIATYLGLKTPSDEAEWIATETRDLWALGAVVPAESQP